MADLAIDPVVQSWIAPLRPEERAALETSVRAEGCRDALVTWNGTLIDGHHRHAICQAHGIPFRTTALEFADLEHVEVWVRQNQAARRNLTDDQRAINSALLAEVLSRIAKRERAQAAVLTREQKAGRLPILSAPVADKIPIDTRKDAADQFGVSEKRTRRAQTIRQQDPDLASQVMAGTLSIKDAEREIRNADRAVAREKAAADAQSRQGETDATIHHASFMDVAARELADDSVGLVFTDPPYHDKTIGIYTDLGTVAARVLKPGGSLLTYTPQQRIPEVIAMLKAAGLTFFWPLAIVHTGKKARMSYFGIVVHWKPVLWFVKGSTRCDIQRFVNDLIESAPQKDAHPWQQGILEARYYIDALTDPGDLVFDPFCGGGTTAVAAAQLDRRWLTCDIDEEAVWIARQRLREAVAA